MNTEYYFDPDSELSRQSQSNTSDSVIENFEITHKNEDENTYLIDITKLLKSDNLTKLKSEPRDYESDSFGVDLYQDLKPQSPKFITIRIILILKSITFFQSCKLRIIKKYFGKIKIYIS